MTFTILQGDVIAQLRTLKDASVHCVVTSPPFWGLRDYQIPSSVWGGDDECAHDFAEEIVDARVAKRGGKGQINGGNSQIDQGRFVKRSTFCARCGAWRGQLGLEPTYTLFVEHIVLVFREVWRVLRDDGTLWMEMGDCYATAAGAMGGNPGGGDRGSKWAGRPVLGQTSWMNGRKLAQLRNGDTGTSSARPAMGMHIPSAKKIGANSSTKEGNGHFGGYGPKQQPNRMPQSGLKAKDMCGIPWRVAFALQDDGWWLRQDVIWNRPNPMPESTRDRCTKAHSYVFLLAKSGRTLLWNHRDGRWTRTRPEPNYIWRNRKTRVETAEPQGEGWARINLWRGFDYYFDQKAIAERASSNSHARMAKMPDGWDTGAGGHGAYHRNGREKGETFRAPGVTPKSAPNDSMIRAKESWHESTTGMLDTRNKRSVWTVATEAFAESHFATFPTALISPCILAGCPPGGVVLDPFGGAGTTALVAQRLGRDSILIELNDKYAAMAERRVRKDVPPLLHEIEGITPDGQAGLFDQAAE